MMGASSQAWDIQSSYYYFMLHFQQLIIETFYQNCLIEKNRSRTPASSQIDFNFAELFELCIPNKGTLKINVLGPNNLSFLIWQKHISHYTSAPFLAVYFSSSVRSARPLSTCMYLCVPGKIFPQQHPSPTSCGLLPSPAWWCQAAKLRAAKGWQQIWQTNHCPASPGKQTGEMA